MYYKMEVKMEDILRNLQLVQLEMLKIVDNICKKIILNILYMQVHY